MKPGKVFFFSISNHFTSHIVTSLNVLLKHKQRRIYNRAFLTRGAGGATAPPLLLIFAKISYNCHEFSVPAPPLLVQFVALPPHFRTAEKGPESKMNFNSPKAKTV